MHHFAFISLALPALSIAILHHRRQDDGGPGPPSIEEEYIQNVCLPSNATGDPDFNAPCNAWAAIEAECVFGSAGLPYIVEVYSSSNDDTLPATPPALDNATQRECVCQFDFFDQFTGCLDCYYQHGAPSVLVYFDFPITTSLSSVSSAYCAATALPSAFLDVLDNAPANIPTSTATGDSDPASVTTSYPDPIGNNTAVSYYFTPSVTGSAAWVVAQVTESVNNSTSGGGGASSSSTSLRISNGQIVATVATASDASASSSSSSSETGSSAAAGASGPASSTKSASGARKTEAAAIVGVMAFAGFFVAI